MPLIRLYVLRLTITFNDKRRHRVCCPQDGVCDTLTFTISFSNAFHLWKQLQSYYKAKPCFSSIPDRAALILACWLEPTNCWAAPPPPPAFRSAPITGSHLETISVNKGAAEELRPRSASPHPPGHHSESNTRTPKPAPKKKKKTPCVLHFRVHVSESVRISVSALVSSSRDLYLAWLQFRKR